MLPFYERNRRIFIGRDPSTGIPFSLTEHLTQVDDKVRNGFMADLIFDWDSKVRFEARYDHQGPSMPHWMMLRLDVTPVERFTLGLIYAAQDKTGGTGIFSPDSLIGASLDVGIWGPFRFFTEFTRRWRRHEGVMEWANESAGGFGLLFIY